MLRIIKWAYDLGVKTEHKRIHDELLLMIGNRPEPMSWVDGKPDDPTFYSRLKGWREAQHMIRSYFEPRPDISADIERMLNEDKI